MGFVYLTINPLSFNFPITYAIQAPQSYLGVPKINSGITNTKAHKELRCLDVCLIFLS